MKKNAPSPATKRRRVAAALAVSALAIGALGSTTASWQDDVDVRTPITTGALGLAVNGDSAEHVIPAAVLDRIVPGETRTYDLDVANTGDVDGTLALAVDSTDVVGTGLDAALVVDLLDSNGEPVIAQTNLTDGVRAIDDAHDDLAAGETSEWTLRVHLPDSAPQALMGNEIESILTFSLVTN